MIDQTPTPLPRSTATNAWDLLQDVKAAMREEPKRVNMNYWQLHLHEGDYAGDTAPAGIPACGTVGCFAGWVCILAGVDDPFDTARKAEDILGPACDFETVPSYAPNVSRWVFHYNGPDIIGNIGTPEYAESVCARIDHFMAVNEDVLKAKVI